MWKSTKNENTLALGEANVLVHCRVTSTRWEVTVPWEPTAVYWDTHKLHRPEARSLALQEACRQVVSEAPASAVVALLDGTGYRTAKRLGVGEANVTRWKKETQTMDRRTRHAILGLLGVEWDSGWKLREVTRANQ